MFAVILRYDYYHNGLLRWDLGWANPNFGGAFVATLLPLLWAFTGGRSRPVTRGAMLRLAIGVLAEALACFLLAKTQSRGAFLAAVGALIWFHACMPPRVAWRPAALRLALLVSCVFATGFASRMAPGFVEADASVTNRWDVLKGGLQLLASAPLEGWGAGMSGKAYTEWFQPAELNASYLALLNGFLTVGVEYGALVLGAVLYGASWCQLGCWRLSHGSDSPEATRVAAAVVGASLVAWWLASLFSNLWVEPLLWVVPGSALAVVFALAIRKHWFRAWRLHAGAAGLALGGTLAAVAGGRVLGASATFAVSPRAPGVIEFRRDASADEAPAIHLWPDSRTTGPRTGPLVKRWAEQVQLRGPVAVHYKFNSPEHALPGEADTVVLFGRQCERLSELAQRKCRQIVLLHPTGTPPRLEGGAGSTVVDVILPAIDQFGTNRGWASWAEANGASVKHFPGIGPYMMRAWSDEMSFALGGSRGTGG